MPQTTQELLETRCSLCGTRNRFPRARATEDPNCGKCKGKVMPRAPVKATDATFHAEVESSPLPVLVDFWAPWCGPCKVMGPVLDQVAAERGGKLKVVKINVDENPGAASRFKVMSIPTLLLLRFPVHLEQMAGAVPKADLDRLLDRHLKKI